MSIYPNLKVNLFLLSFLLETNETSFNSLPKENTRSWEPNKECKKTLLGAHDGSTKP